MTTIYFDESGQTGAHLFDAQQPSFGLGSTDLDEAEAKDLLARCFPDYKGDEIKSKIVLKSGEGRRQFLAFAAEVGKAPDRFCASRIDKRFTIISKMVDNLVEPMMSAQGYDFYADDYAVRYANMVAYAFDELLGRDKVNPILHSYNEFARHPNPEAMADLADRLGSAAAAAPEGPKMFLEQMQWGAEAFSDFHDMTEFVDTNDVHVTAAVSVMSFWQEQHEGGFDIVHDESIHFFDREERWKMITDPTLPPEEIVLGRKRLKLPIPVMSTLSARSHECSSLQVADLIAGFTTRTSSSKLTPQMEDFIAEAMDRGFNKMSFYPIEAGREFVGGPPARASGPDVVDRIVSAVGKSTKPQ